MKKIQQILKCKKGFRCHSHLSCKKCGDIWQRNKFKNFCLNLDKCNLSNVTSLTYIVIKSNKISNLKNKLEDIINFLDDIKLLKKRNKISTFYSRLEVSFSKAKLGFHPHINFLVWGDISLYRELANKHNLAFWHSKKKNDTDTIKSIIWYSLKYNSIGVEEGEAVRVALDRKNTILASKEFTNIVNYTDELIDLDFCFMGIYPIRSKKEIELRDAKRLVVRDLNLKIKELQDETLR